jgi:hypothetical protein
MAALRANGTTGDIARVTLMFDGGLPAAQIDATRQLTSW